MKRFTLEAVILAAGLVVMGVCIKKGLDSFADNSRVVTVKGLAEMEVNANQVRWPMVHKVVGDDLETIYNDVQQTNRQVVEFLKAGGLSDNEISITPPSLIDFKAERYSSDYKKYRYNVTETIVVSSDKVDAVRELIKQQGELLKKGVAIVTNEYDNRISYDYTLLNDIKPTMIEQATQNARSAAEKFAKDSGSKIGKIKTANQGQFSIENLDSSTPHIKKVRVVSTIVYTLED